MASISSATASMSGELRARWSAAKPRSQSFRCTAAGVTRRWQTEASVRVIPPWPTSGLPLGSGGSWSGWPGSVATATAAVVSVVPVHASDAMGTSSVVTLAESGCRQAQPGTHPSGGGTPWTASISLPVARPAAGSTPSSTVSLDDPCTAQDLCSCLGLPTKLGACVTVK